MLSAGPHKVSEGQFLRHLIEFFVSRQVYLNGNLNNIFSSFLKNVCVLVLAYELLQTRKIKC